MEGQFGSTVFSVDHGTITTLLSSVAFNFGVVSCSALRVLDALGGDSVALLSRAIIGSVFGGVGRRNCVGVAVGCRRLSGGGGRRLTALLLGALVSILLLFRVIDLADLSLGADGVEEGEGEQGKGEQGKGEQGEGEKGEGEQGEGEQVEGEQVEGESEE